jgi:sulfite exporter TauE/SafE
MEAIIGTVLVASLLGSPHCVGMCGPFVALTTLGRGPTPSSRQAWERIAAYNVGRLVAYVVIGTLAGALGLALDLGGELAGVQRSATTVAGLVMIAVGVVGLARQLGLRVGLPSVGPAVGDTVRRVFGHADRLSPRRRAWAMGIATSLMPCGWLYVFAVAAAGTGSPLRGALTMGVFWLGTVPALSIFGATVARLSGPLRRRLPMITSVLILAVGVFTLVMRARVTIPVADVPTAADAPLPETPPCHPR